MFETGDQISSVWEMSVSSSLQGFPRAPQLPGRSMAGRALGNAAAGSSVDVLGYHRPQPCLAGAAEQGEGGMERWALGTPSR